MDPIDRSLFAHRIQSICVEMGATLQRSAFSPNIRDRLDFSCAVFDAAGGLCAQAAHIPVHLGSMAFAMRAIADRFPWQDGDMMILNDPYLGGTHLPDVSLIAPVFSSAQLAGFVASRAHFADIGGATPGSMPLARRLEEEGMVIPPTWLVREFNPVDRVLAGILRGMRSPQSGRADLMAQISANQRGALQLKALIRSLGVSEYIDALIELNDYGARVSRAGLQSIPDGDYAFEDYMDDDGMGHDDIPIRVRLQVRSGRIHVDFAGTAAQVDGNINCPLSVAAAAVYYCFYCLMPPETPACAGAFRSITLSAPDRCLVNAAPPAAVAAGNVETSSRIVDAILGALAPVLPERIPAASQGTMNNVAMGAPGWDYYETVGGGTGGNSRQPGLDGVQSHMTNTRNTPIEVVELHYPLRVSRYAIRSGSGGVGRHRGGNGLLRGYEFLLPATVTILSERRRRPPWGLNGGRPGQCGVNRLYDRSLPGKVCRAVFPGDRLTIETPGGGAFGMALHLPVTNDPSRAA